jgi:23S rRNA pseudouridine2605 synthase
MIERLQKYMAKCGVASRRKCEEIIGSGRVRVNDIEITEFGYKVDLDKDTVYVDGKKISLEENKIYIALNKPVGYLSAVKDDRGKKTIIELVDVKERIYPIGRLDYDTSGLILLTNDGTIYNRVIHPRQEVNKVYIATVKGVPTKEEMKKFSYGIDIGDYVTAPASIKILEENAQGCRLKIAIHEGKNRQVRRMCAAIYHPVISLQRISVGNIKLGDLKVGSYRYLSEMEIDYLNSL